MDILSLFLLTYTTSFLLLKYFPYVLLLLPYTNGFYVPLFYVPLKIIYKYFLFSYILTNKERFFATLLDERFLYIPIILFFLVSR